MRYVFGIKATSDAKVSWSEQECSSLEDAKKHAESFAGACYLGGALGIYEPGAAHPDALVLICSAIVTSGPLNWRRIY